MAAAAQEEEKDKQEEETSAPPEESEEVKERKQERKAKKQKQGLPWVIGFMALTNLIFVYNDPTQKVTIIGKAQIALSILVWAASFVPGIRYVSLIIMLPVWFRNFMVSGVPMMERFSKGESILLQQNKGPDFNLKDALDNYKDENPKV